MRRQVLQGRFGAGDRVAIPAAKDEVVTRLDLVASGKLLDHGIGGALTNLKKHKVFPTEIGLDLLIPGQRNARAIALAMALSIRRQGDAQVSVLPSGAITSFRPPRVRMEIGMRTVSRLARSTVTRVEALVNQEVGALCISTKNRRAFSTKNRLGVVSPENTKVNPFHSSR